MNIFPYVLIFLSAGLFFYSIYYFARTISIYKKIDKHLFFSISSFSWFLYMFFQLMLSIGVDPEKIILFHKLKLAALFITAPFFELTIYTCFFEKGKKFVPLALLFSAPIFLLLIPFNLLLTLPVKKLEFYFFFSNYIHYIATTHVMYSIYSALLLLSFIISIVYKILSRTNNKTPFIVIFICGILGGLNDFAVAHNLIKNIMITEYLFFSFITYVFINFLSDDLKSNNELIYQKNEAERRLRITEVYTRRSIVEVIEKGNDPTSFSPSIKNLSILFSDIRNFTGISENRSPLKTVAILNEYFTVMNENILKNNGEIDKLIGDCIMALFVNPDDSVKSAIEMKSLLRVVNEKFQPKINIQNGIGINYGTVISGNIGSPGKMDFTVIGDIVNTANRIEALTKYYGVSIIISEELKNELHNEYNTRFLDTVLVKGKKQPTKIYEIYDFEEQNIVALKNKTKKYLEEAFSYYSQGEFDKALKIYQGLKNKIDQHFGQTNVCVDPILDFYIERSNNLKIKKDSDRLLSWNGVFEFYDK